MLRKKRLFGKTKPETVSNILAVLVAILIITVLVNTYLVWQMPIRQVITTPTGPEGSGPEVPSLEGYMEVEITTEPGTIYMASGCTEISMVADVKQTDSIQQGLEGRLGYRPITHDILWDILDGFNIKLSSVRITRMEESTYFAQLVLIRDNMLLVLDSRPSDAIAIAVRTGSPVYVKEDLMVDYGNWVC